MSSSIALEGCGRGDGRAGNSPRLLRVVPCTHGRDATLSGRGLGASFFVGGFFCDLFAYGVEVVHYIVICKADHAHTELLEGNGSCSVSSQTCGGVMLRAVEFNDEFVRGAVEIRDVLPNRSLPQPTYRLIVQKLIPKLAFRRRQRPAQLLRERRQPFVVRQPSHPTIFAHQPTPNPLEEGVAPRQRAGGASRPPAAIPSLKSRGHA